MQSAKKDQRIFVNGEPQDVPAGCTIELLIARLEMGDRRVAVAVNLDVIPRSTFGEVCICDGDRVEILEAVGGG